MDWITHIYTHARARARYYSVKLFEVNSHCYPVIKDFHIAINLSLYTGCKEQPHQFIIIVRLISDAKEL